MVLKIRDIVKNKPDGLFFTRLFVSERKQIAIIADRLFAARRSEMRIFMKYTTILFDLDGTLLDTLKDLTVSINYALKQLGFPERTIDEVRRFVGNGMAKLVERALSAAGAPASLAKSCLTLFSGYYKEHIHDYTVAYPGVTQLLQTLKKAGCKLAIVSNKMDDPVKSLANLYFPDLIDAAIGTPSDHKKPDPYCVYTALHKLHSTPEQSIYIGDSHVDVETAKNAGIPCICVSWGFAGRKGLAECHPDIIVDTADELASLLEL